MVACLIRWNSILRGPIDIPLIVGNWRGIDLGSFDSLFLHKPHSSLQSTHASSRPRWRVVVRIQRVGGDFDRDWLWICNCQERKKILEHLFFCFFCFFLLSISLFPLAAKGGQGTYLFADSATQGSTEDRFDFLFGPSGTHPISSWLHAGVEAESWPMEKIWGLQAEGGFVGTGVQWRWVLKANR